MLFQKKNRSKTDGAPQAEKGLYPVLYVINVLKDYQKDMVRKEVESLQELGMVGSAFNKRQELQSPSFRQRKKWSG